MLPSTVDSMPDIASLDELEQALELAAVSEPGGSMASLSSGGPHDMHGWEAELAASR